MASTDPRPERVQPIRIGRRAGFPLVFAMVAVFASMVPVFGVGPVAGASEPAPACRGVYRDVRTEFDGYADWDTVVVDTIFMVPRSYRPRDLVKSGVAGGQQVRRVVVTDLRAMMEAAGRDRAALEITSAYRSYATQVSTFNRWVSTSGRGAALLASARPGHSEHQLGTAMDFTSRHGSDPWAYADWAKTRAGAWMKVHSWEFGFVNSYPKGPSPSITCYKYEPWHFRYVGRDLAEAIHDSGLTPREFLWAARHETTP